MRSSALTGVFVVDKPAGWTSHDVVSRIRRIAQIQKVGHLGTLDPIATGVLPILVGRATRLSRFLHLSEKVYEGTIRFGYSTHTYDSAGTPTSPEVTIRLDCSVIEEHLNAFRGKVLQVPPAVSAKKVAGKAAYKLVRENLPVELAPVEVEISALNLLRCEGQEIDIRVRCGAGTYVRSIAHELGQRVGCGGHLSCLRRTSAGSFQIEDAVSLEVLADLAAGNSLQEALIQPDRLLPDFPAVTVDSSTAGFIRQGRDFHLSPFRLSAQNAPFVKAVTADGELVAIGEARLPNIYHPVVVL